MLFPVIVARSTEKVGDEIAASAFFRDEQDDEDFSHCGKRTFASFVLRFVTVVCMATFALGAPRGNVITGPLGQPKLARFVRPRWNVSKCRARATARLTW